MGIGQTSYDLTMDLGFPGMIADNGPCVAESFVADEAIGFGLGVVKGATTDAKTPTGESVKLPDEQTDVFRGVTRHKHLENSYPYTEGSSTYAEADIVDVVRKGKIWVQIDGTCTIDGTVYVTTDGKFTSTEGTNTIATGCVFRKVETDKAILEINLP
mgnify:CR=1 FL=1